MYLPVDAVVIILSKGGAGVKVVVCFEFVLKLKLVLEG